MRSFPFKIRRRVAQPIPNNVIIRTRENDEESDIRRLGVEERKIRNDDDDDVSRRNNNNGNDDNNDAVSGLRSRVVRYNIVDNIYIHICIYNVDSTYIIPMTRHIHKRQ